jgi:hypothetical protein
MIVPEAYVLRIVEPVAGRPHEPGGSVARKRLPSTRRPPNGRCLRKVYSVSSRSTMLSCYLQARLAERMNIEMTLGVRHYDHCHIS